MLNLINRSAESMKRPILAIALLVGSCAPVIASAAGPDLPVFGASATAPAVSRVIGSVKASACRTADTSDAQPQAIDRLKQRAVAEGATAVVDLKVKVRMSATAYLRGSGFPNPCRFETDVKGTAVVLAAAQPG